jgi:hypothetical protein
VWLDIQARSKTITAQLTVSTGGGDSMAVPASSMCSHIHASRDSSGLGDREKAVTIVWAMEDFHPPGTPDPAPPAKCREDACEDGNVATLWGRLQLFANRGRSRRGPRLDGHPRAT